MSHHSHCFFSTVETSFFPDMASNKEHRRTTEDLSVRLDKHDASVSQFFVEYCRKQCVEILPKLTVNERCPFSCDRQAHHLQDNELRGYAYRLNDMEKRLDYAQQYAEKYTDTSMLAEVHKLQEQLQLYQKRINDLVQSFASMKM